ncbi:PREDICTED: FTS and Hook-interacting protein [Gekko japonicus]|uniref:FTS and Hook-interacting protein n=1 Tax=Gekko japonicus TaxID=146911 RepID=A0ABM1KU55_GEKJA|nr:PREDICTED: FTS and Hook-interacting protein [Gekko japonicus]
MAAAAEEVVVVVVGMGRVVCGAPLLGLGDGLGGGGGGSFRGPCQTESAGNAADQKENGRLLTDMRMTMPGGALGPTRGGPGVGNLPSSGVRKSSGEPRLSHAEQLRSQAWPAFAPEGAGVLRPLRAASGVLPGGLRRARSPRPGGLRWGRGSQGEKPDKAVVTSRVREARGPLRLLGWHLQPRELPEERKVELLKLFEVLISQSHQPLLQHPPVRRPLLRLLGRCAGPASPPVESSLVLLLNQLCVSVAREPPLLELFFRSPSEQGPANLLVFSLLVPFVHREGLVGQQARDALLLLMAMSAGSRTVAQYITDNSYFCPVLATGLSALYSSLPRKLEVRGDDWHFLRREDWIGVPSLVLFMNSLEFCNAVIQVAHPLVQKQLVDYIHNGFLVPVMGPALHKTSIEEMIASTAYLDLFLRSVTETALLKTFLRFLLLHRHDNSTILDTLVGRIASNSRLCMVSLSLFRTLLSLHCEDVLLQVVLRYLIPCSPVMLSQKRAHPARWEEVSELDGNYLEYLRDARLHVDRCVRACRAWSAPYDGEVPGASSLAPPLDASLPISSDHFGYTSFHPGGHPGHTPTSPRTKKRGLSEEVAGPEGAPLGAQPSPPTSPGPLDPGSGGLLPLLNGAHADTGIKKVRRCPQGPVVENGSGPGPRPEPTWEQTVPCLDSLLDDLLTPPPPLENGGTSSPSSSTTTLENQLEEEMNGGGGRGGETLTPGPPPEPDPLSCEEEEAFRSFASHPDGAGQPRAADPLAQIIISPPRTPSQPPSQPFTGPLVAVLFAKLENMLQNSLYVNFLLTGLLSQLACYPQPLLRSFLLNTNMVFQPSVKSLLQVLGSVKNKIERFAADQEDFPSLLFKAKKYLIARGKLDWSDAQNAAPSLRRSETLVKSRKPSIGELIMRHTNSPTRARQAAQLALQHMREGQVMHALAGAPPLPRSARDTLPFKLFLAQYSLIGYLSVICIIVTCTSTFFDL